MSADAWDRRLAACRAALAPAHALVGEWAGEGHAHGEPVRARLRVRPILGDTAIEAWEEVGAHADLCIYRWDADVAQLEVLHLMEGAVAQHPVEATPEGLVWVTPPDQPAVLWSLRGAALESEVIWPGQRVAEVRIVYRRA